MSDYRVVELSDIEKKAFLEKRGILPSRALKNEHRKILLSDGLELKGSFEVTAKDAATGQVDWHHAQDNLITDIGRSAFFDVGWTSIQLGFAPSTEAPNILRPGIPTDGSQVVQSGNLGNGSVNPATYTKTWGPHTFSQPAANRTLGILFVSYYNGGGSANMGVTYCWSYALLTPPKTQTTTQTVELIYKMAINPIY